MKATVIGLMVLVQLVAQGSAQTEQIPLDVRSLVEAERAFAATYSEKGAREAFLAHLADTAIIFRPYPTEGKKWYQDRVDVVGSVKWQPLYVEVSQAGDLGFTTGPWSYGSADTNTPLILTQSGQYAAVWRKQADGVWRVVIDMAITQPQTNDSNSKFRYLSRAGEDPKNRAASGDMKSEEADLLQTDVTFSAASAVRGYADAYLAQVTDDIRYYRSKTPPIIGKIALKEVLSSWKGVLTWQPVDARVSESGDLGYTYGTADLSGGSQTEASSYLRVWRKAPDGKWKVAADMAEVIPPPTITEVPQPNPSVAQ